MREPSEHKATIGRMLWLWCASLDGVIDETQAFSAQVVFVNTDDTVNVIAYTHSGVSFNADGVVIHDYEDDEHSPDNEMPFHATWMPYQKKVMDKEKSGG